MGRLRGAFVAIAWLLSYLDEVPSLLLSNDLAEPVEEWTSGSRLD